MVDEAVSFHNPLFSVDALTRGWQIKISRKKNTPDLRIVRDHSTPPAVWTKLMAMRHGYWSQYTELVMNDKAKNKCAHPNCTCKAAADSKFCSPYCESAKSSTAISCECGHAGCGGQLTR